MQKYNLKKIYQYKRNVLIILELKNKSKKRKSSKIKNQYLA